MSRAQRALVWSHLAMQRLVEIRDGITAKNPRAATETLRLLLARTTQLIDFPELGRAVPELAGSELRELVVKHYRIVYRVREEAIQVVTVFEGYREFPRADVAGPDDEDPAP